MNVGTAGKRGTAGACVGGQIVVLYAQWIEDSYVGGLCLDAMQKGT